MAQAETDCSVGRARAPGLPNTYLPRYLGTYFSGLGPACMRTYLDAAESTNVTGTQAARRPISSSMWRGNCYHCHGYVSTMVPTQVPAVTLSTCAQVGRPRVPNGSCRPRGPSYLPAVPQGRRSPGEQRDHLGNQQDLTIWTGGLEALQPSRQPFPWML